MQTQRVRKERKVVWKWRGVQSERSVIYTMSLKRRVGRKKTTDTKLET